MVSDTGSASRCRLVVLISGRGSNLKAIIDAVRAQALPVDVRAVVCNRPDAAGLEHARAAGIATEVIDHRAYPDRGSFEDALQRCIDRYQPDLVALAGFMRVLDRAFIDHYWGHLMNIHPSLLPAFPGLRTHERALADGVAEHGATVHFVTHEVDRGPVILRARVPVLPGDTAESLAARVLREEHRIYPLAIRWFAEGRLRLENGEARLDGRPTEQFPEEPRREGRKT